MPRDLLASQQQTGPRDLLEGIAAGPSQLEVEEPSPLDEVMRQVGLTGRYLGEGLPMVATMVGDAANTGINFATKGINKVAGTNIPPLQMPSQMVSEGLTKVGLPQPQTPVERVVGDASRAIASIPTMAAGAAASGIKALAPITENFGIQGAAAAGSGASAGTARELGAPPIVQFGAGLLGGVAAGARVARNPQQTARLQAFEESGITPNAADVNQTRLMQGTRKLSEEVPFAGVPEREVKRLQQASDRKDRLAQRTGTPTAADGLGNRVQSEIETYRFGRTPDGMTPSDVIKAPTRETSVSAKAEALYNRIEIPPDAVVEADRTQVALQAAARKFTSTELSMKFADKNLEDLNGIIERADNMVTWADLRQLRTEIRYQRDKAALDPSIDERGLALIDKALTEDMMAGAKVHGGERGVQLVRRADSFYAQSMARLGDAVKSVYGANRAESVYQQIKLAMSPNAARADINKLEQLRRVLPRETWEDVAATIIDDLGKPTPGAVGAPGRPNFSVSKFVTDYANISPSAKNVLFNLSGHGDLRRSLDSLNDALASMKATDRLANVTQSGVRGGQIAVGVGAMSDFGMTAGVLGGLNVTARAMYNPTFVRLMTTGVRAASPGAKQAAAAQVVRFGMANPAYYADASELLKALVPVRAAPSEESK